MRGRYPFQARVATRRGSEGRRAPTQPCDGRVCVRVTREQPGQHDHPLCVEALLVFVNVGEDGRPLPVPPLALETDEDRRLAADAGARKLARKQARS